MDGKRFDSCRKIFKFMAEKYFRYQSKLYVDIECAWNWKLLVPDKVEAFSVSYELYLCDKDNVLFIQILLVTLNLFYQ